MIKVRIVMLPFLLPTWAAAQVLLPRCILIARGNLQYRSLLAHELRHVMQIEEMGLLRYWFTYLFGLVRHGYHRHPMEEDANSAVENIDYRVAAARILVSVKPEKFYQTVMVKL